MISIRSDIGVKIANSLWVSFVAACIATMVFFAMFDPETLGHVTTWPISLTRLEGYTVGFLLFWLLTASTALMTVLSLPKTKKDAA